MQKIKKIFSLLFILLMANNINAQSLSFLSDSYKTESQAEPLSADEAFVSEFDNLGETLQIILDIAPNHYLYKDKIKVLYNGVQQNLNLKDGTLITDEFFGTTEVYNYGFSFGLKSKFYKDTEVEIFYQGCSKEFNLCYPPQSKNITIKGDIKYKNDIAGKIENNNIISDNTFNIKEISTTNDANVIVKFINDYKSTPIIYIIFILIGVTIAFTPCIYPLIPIVIASTSNSKNKPISTLYYILGMILCYTSIGLITGFLNFNLQIFIQNVYFIYLISFVIFILSLYMLGFINFILPSNLNNSINNIILKINPDNYKNQILIGFLSSLVLSPCSIAPLLGVLIFINQLGEPLFGSILLSFMAIGIGIPIFLFSTSFHKFMPKNGSWLNEIKNIIGIIMLFIIIYLLKFKISEFLIYISYSLILIIYSLHLLSFSFKKIIAILIFLFSFFFINYQINLNSLINDNNSIVKNELKLNYKVIDNLDKLNNFIKNSDRPIFIDYYADWCITCVKMENTTLKNYDIIKMLNNNYFMVKIDLTDINQEEQNIMDNKNILAIPYYSIINKNKKEFIYSGEMKEDVFKNLLIKHNE